VAVDLLASVAKFAPVDDCSFETVIYRTHVPFVAPRAYLHAIFKPTSAEVYQKRTAELGITGPVADFYRLYNGAILFSGAIAIYGLLPDTYQLNRKDWFEKALPYNILEPNRQYESQLRRRDQLYVGAYGLDLSAVCVTRKEGAVTCYEGDGFKKVRAVWPSFCEWLRSELIRLSACFDEYGHQLTGDDLLLPTQLSVN